MTANVTIWKGCSVPSSATPLTASQVDQQELVDLDIIVIDENIGNHIIENPHTGETFMELSTDEVPVATHTGANILLIIWIVALG